MAVSNVTTNVFPDLKPMLIDWMCLEQEETGGDKFLFWNEANAIQSAQRIESLDAKVREFYSESVNFAVESYLYDKRYLIATARQEGLYAALGLFSDDCGVLLEEFVKSAAELCIKKMRLGALVDKPRAKRTTLMIEVNEARRIHQELRHKIAPFNKKKFMIEATEARRIRQEIQDKIAAFNNKLSVARKKQQEITNMQYFNTNVKSGAGFTNEMLRVVVEMMRYGVEGQRPLVLKLEYGWIVGRLWYNDVINVIIQKVCVEAVMDRVSVFEGLKREIAENWKMEKQVKDRIVVYQMEHHARLSPGFVAKVGPGEDTIKGESSGVGAVVEGEETVQEKKSERVAVVEGDETIEVKKSEGGAVVEGEEPVQEKNSEAWTVVEGGETIEEKNRGVSTVVEGDETTIEGTLGEWVLVV